MQSTEREVPKTFMAALNHLGATVILMFSMTLELIVLVIIRIGNRIEGKTNPKADTPAKAASPTEVQPRRKAKAVRVVATTVVDDEFERAMAAATAARTTPAPLVTQMAMDMTSPPQRATPDKHSVAPTVTTIAPLPTVMKDPPKATVPDEPARSADIVDEQTYVGTISWAGHKRHPGNGKEYVCFTVYLKSPSGDVKMLQATSLQVALKLAHVEVGDNVTIKMGRECIGIVNGTNRYRNNCVVTKH